MNTYLYTWNPDKWKWEGMKVEIDRVADGMENVGIWSCGNTKKIEIGDQFFLIKLGKKDSTGIIACGNILSKPYLKLHWDTQKEESGEKALRTDIQFNFLSDKPIVSLSDLRTKYPNYTWTPQRSGISIPKEIASELSSLIQEKTKGRFQPLTKEEIKHYREGNLKILTVKSYDRSSAARQECIKAYGYNCAVCNFNFENVYGTLGKEYIEVHHLKPIANIGKEYLIDPIHDLRPVCANCHRMLHTTTPPISIEELKEIREHILSC